jgi:hypothetical protein
MAVTQHAQVPFPDAAPGLAGKFLHELRLDHFWRERLRHDANADFVGDTVSDAVLDPGIIARGVAAPRTEIREVAEQHRVGPELRRLPQAEAPAGSGDVALVDKRRMTGNGRRMIGVAELERTVV